MGVAIIMIMFCHLDIAQEHNGVSITSLAGYLQVLTVGVDIFMLVSGLGLYYSYTKNPISYFRFEKKRILRVLPWYLVIAGVTYFVYDILIKHLGFLRFIQDYTFISWVRFNKSRYWYILAIMVFYLVFPLVYRIVNNKRFNALWLLVFVVGWFGGLTLELYLLHQSYMILFEYPYQLLHYVAVAFVLPTVTALMIWLCRKGIKQRKAKNEVL